jgi:isopentenyl-diphosphate delta-isomerase
MVEQIILVDEKDTQVGIGEKLDVHQKGLLHRAFSIFIYNSKGEMMLQKRAKSKYHCGGLWTNTVCGHPRPGESLDQAAVRRLYEEMGFRCSLTKVLEYRYTVKFDNGLTENEFLHVYKGFFDGIPKVNPGEADDWKWINVDVLKKDLRENPDNYTYWFKLSMEKL